MTGNLGTDLLIYGISALFAIVAIVGLVEQIKHHRRVNSSEYAVANGTIIDIKTEVPKRNQSIQYQAIYEFTAQDGKTYRHVSHDVGQTFQPQIGFRRKIAYKISDPTQSEYYTNNRGLIIAIVSIFCAVGIIFAVVSFLGTGMF